MPLLEERERLSFPHATIASVHIHLLLRLWNVSIHRGFVASRLLLLLPLQSFLSLSFCLVAETAGHLRFFSARSFRLLSSLTRSCVRTPRDISVELQTSTSSQSPCREGGGYKSVEISLSRSSFCACHVANVRWAGTGGVRAEFLTDIGLTFLSCLEGKPAQTEEKVDRETGKKKRRERRRTVETRHDERGKRRTQSSFFPCLSLCAESVASPHRFLSLSLLSFSLSLISFSA